MKCSKNKVLINKRGKSFEEKIVANCTELLQLNNKYSSHVNSKELQYSLAFRQQRIPLLNQRQYANFEQTYTIIYRSFPMLVQEVCMTHLLRGIRFLRG